jgi:hypothetical protein
MEISYSNDGERSDDDPYSLFIFAINAEETKQKYATRLKKFLQLIGIDRQMELTVQERCKIFTDKLFTVSSLPLNVYII